MKKRTWTMLLVVGLGSLVLPPLLEGAAGEPVQPPNEKDKEPDKGPPFGFKGKFKGGPGFFGPGGQARKLVKQFDKDGDGRLNKEERAAAREFLKKEGKGGFGKG